MLPRRAGSKLDGFAGFVWSGDSGRAIGSWSEGGQFRPGAMLHPRGIPPPPSRTRTLHSPLLSGAPPPSGEAVAFAGHFSEMDPNDQRPKGLTLVEEDSSVTGTRRMGMATPGLYRCNCPGHGGSPGGSDGLPRSQACIGTPAITLSRPRFHGSNGRSHRSGCQDWRSNVSDLRPVHLEQHGREGGHRFVVRRQSALETPPHPCPRKKSGNEPSFSALGAHPQAFQIRSQRSNGRVSRNERSIGTYALIFCDDCLTGIHVYV
jgi:hypothetical protein